MNNDGEYDIDMCRSPSGVVYASRIDLIDLIQGGCPNNEVTQWLLKALTRPGELPEGEGTITFGHDNMSCDIDGISTESGTYLRLNHLSNMFRKLRPSLESRAEKTNFKDDMLDQIQETFDVIDRTMGDLTRLLGEYWGDCD